MDDMSAKPTFDRSQEDLGNVVELGHVNVLVPDQSKATAFYLMGLGLTRDPYLMAGLENMWVNVGRGQFHPELGVIRSHAHHRVRQIPARLLIARIMRPANFPAVGIVIRPRQQFVPFLWHHLREHQRRQKTRRSVPARISEVFPILRRFANRLQRYIQMVRARPPEELLPRIHNQTLIVLNVV